MSHPWRRLLVLVLILAGVGAAIVAFPGLAEVRRALAGAQPQWVALVAALELGSCLAYVVAFQETFCRQLPWGLSTRVGFAEQGTNVLVPTGGAGGLALGAWALSRAGCHPSGSPAGASPSSC